MKQVTTISLAREVFTPDTGRFNKVDAVGIVPGGMEELIKYQQEASEKMYEHQDNCTHYSIQAHTEMNSEVVIKEQNLDTKTLITNLKLVRECQYCGNCVISKNSKDIKNIDPEKCPDAIFADFIRIFAKATQSQTK